MPSNRGKGRGDARGFAGMDADRQRVIASRGGETVSQDREHMAEIGREGGHHSHAAATTSGLEPETDAAEPEAIGD